MDRKWKSVYVIAATVAYVLFVWCVIVLVEWATGYRPSMDGVLAVAAIHMCMELGLRQYPWREMS